MAMIVNREGIKTIDQARDLIAQILETLEINKAEGSTDAMLFEFMDHAEFGYCGDCEERMQEPDRDPNG